MIMTLKNGNLWTEILLGFLVFQNELQVVSPFEHTRHAKENQAQHILSDITSRNVHI